MALAVEKLILNMCADAASITVTSILQVLAIYGGARLLTSSFNTVTAS